MSSQSKPSDDYRPDEAALQEMVAQVDTGPRHPTGVAGKILLWTAIAWSLFQLWYASPLPFILHLFVLNDTEARAIHLALRPVPGVYRLIRRSGARRATTSRSQDWVMALLGAFSVALPLSVLRRALEPPRQPHHVRSGRSRSSA